MLSLLWFMTISMIACDDKTGEDNGSDGDGDGYLFGEDCDDSDPTIYPGAPEVWYDGVDGDCADDDDYDADGDGDKDPSGGGLDCDDSDASIYPGAPEVWYDGIDGDCDGGSDYDADGDGFDSDEYGGDDCDDADAATSPGAAETWYDGIDGDCDGGNDYDADGDGYESSDHGGDDCNDADAATHPDAEEVWYDGEDGDCDGSSDYDADGDGYISDEHGGDDCGDDSTAVYPGADELIDGRDNDCDGSGDDFAVGDDYGGIVVLGSDTGGGTGEALSLGDVDGDGLVDLAVLQSSDQYYSDTGGGAVHVLINSQLLASVATSSATYRVLASTEPLDGVWFLSDIDGDGISELAVASSQGRGVVGIASQSELSSALDVTDAGRVFTAESIGGELGAAVASWPDMDGDGVDEVIIGEPGASTVHLFSSDGLLSTGSWSSADADVALTGSDDEAGAALLGIGDIDGDGYGDLAVGAPGVDAESGAVYLLTGSPTYASGLLSTRAWLTISGDEEGDRTGQSLTLGDTDGDGSDDLLIAATGEDTRAGRVHVILATDLSSGAASLSSLDTVSYGGVTINGYAGMAMASGADVNGDGMHDILIGGPGDSSGVSDGGEVWSVISGETGARALVNAASSFYGETDDSAGAAVGMADINGDGLGDLVMGVPGEESILTDEGAVYIGFSGYGD